MDGDARFFPHAEEKAIADRLPFDQIHEPAKEVLDRPRIEYLLDAARSALGAPQGRRPATCHSWLAGELKNELPELKGLPERNIGRMIAFYQAYPDPAGFSPPAVAKSLLHEKSATSCRGIVHSGARSLGMGGEWEPFGSSDCLPNPFATASTSRRRSMVAAQRS